MQEKSLTKQSAELEPAKYASFDQSGSGINSKGSDNSRKVKIPAPSLKPQSDGRIKKETKTKKEKEEDVLRLSQIDKM